MSATMRDIIQKHSPDFDAEQFLKGAESAYETILEAYASGDLETLKSLLSPKVLAGFRADILARKKRNEKLELTLLGITKTRFRGAQYTKQRLILTLAFHSDQIIALRDRSNQLIEGDEKTIVKLVDIWKFSRNPKDPDPNWTLIETQDG